MFIYAGLIASIAMASQPAPPIDASPTDTGLRPLVLNTPMYRSDI